MVEEEKNSANEAVTFLKNMRPGQMRTLQRRFTRKEMQIIKTQLGRMGIHGITFDIQSMEQGDRTVIYRPERERKFRRR